LGEGFLSPQKGNAEFFMNTDAQDSTTVLGDVRLSVRPVLGDNLIPFEELIKMQIFSHADAKRLNSYTVYERLWRAMYHKRRYLKHLTEDELHLRAGYMIANVVYISSRHRYSSNNLYSLYWQNKLAHTAEELAIRNCIKGLSDEVLSHIPCLGFSTPQEPALKHDTRVNTLYRYGNIEFIHKLHKNGEIYLRCGSTKDEAENAAREDANELCIELHLLADEISTSFTNCSIELPETTEVIGLNINQKTDYYMFCLSQVYDWRLFGDFGTNTKLGTTEDKTACLVITDTHEFEKRLLLAARDFIKEKQPGHTHELLINSGSAYYYDQYDSQECAPLFNETGILPFAKRREYTYQHEYRFIIKPDLPKDFIPSYSPSKLPKFERDFLNIGSLEDISYIIEPDIHSRETQMYYLFDKDINLLASAIGVTMPNLGDTVSFVYSVEKKEIGRSDSMNLVNSKRNGGISVQMHEQQINIPLKNGCDSILDVMCDFYRVFDIREHGNHLITLAVNGDNLRNSTSYKYRAYLPAAEPKDDEIDEFRVAFAFEYSFLNQNGNVFNDSEVIEFDGYAYLSGDNGVGELRRRPTYRSLLVAEMEFVQRLFSKDIKCLLSYDCKSRELGYRCSEFKAQRKGQIEGA